MNKKRVKVQAKIADGKKSGVKSVEKNSAKPAGKTSAGLAKSAVKGPVKSPVFAQVYEIVRRIPEGKVLTYGLISSLMGSRLSAQGVGWALNALPAQAREGKNGYSSQTVPWHRVINSRGGLSTNKIADVPPGMQKRLLEAEGVLFNEEEKLSLDQYLWTDGLKA